MTQTNIPAVSDVTQRFRKKPVEIEAFRSGFDKNPEWFAAAIESGTAWWNGGEEPGYRIKTLEGVMLASPGDWIVRGIKGELYPVKPDIFAATYESVGAFAVSDDEQPLTAEFKAAELQRRAEAAEARIAELERGGWRPIETAPKNKLILTGWFNSGGNWRSEHGRYYGHKELALDDYAENDSDNEEDYAPAGWYGGGLECERLYNIRPTHWMPLPAPPAPQPSTGGE